MSTSWQCRRGMCEQVGAARACLGQEVRGSGDIASWHLSLFRNSHCPLGASQQSVGTAEQDDWLLSEQEKLVPVLRTQCSQVGSVFLYSFLLHALKNSQDNLKSYFLLVLLILFF